MAEVQERAVSAGLSRRPVAAATTIGVDETSFQRWHEYVTVVNDLTTTEPRVLYVADRRAGAALEGYFDAVGEAGCGRIQMVAMDMWPACIRSVRKHGGADRVRQATANASAMRSSSISEGSSSTRMVWSPTRFPEASLNGTTPSNPRSENRNLFLRRPDEAPECGPT